MSHPRAKQSHTPLCWKDSPEALQNLLKSLFRNALSVLLRGKAMKSSGLTLEIHLWEKVAVGLTQEPAVARAWRWTRLGWSLPYPRSSDPQVLPWQKIEGCRDKNGCG